MWSTNDHAKQVKDEHYSSSDRQSPPPVWLKLQWPTILILFAISFALGFLGFTKYSITLGLDLSSLDMLYRTLQLAVLESGSVSGSIPWELELARWALPLLTAYTAILTLATIFRQQFKLLRLRFLSSHVIVCGLGAKGLQLAEMFASSGEEVVAIELIADHPSIPVCNELGITTLIGDARETAYLKKARVEKAKHLIIVCGDDGTNLEIAVRARELQRDRSGAILTCAVHIVNPRLYTLLREEELGFEAYPRIRLEVFNLYERGARELVRTYPVPPSEQTAASGPSKVMIVGLGKLGKGVLIQIARDVYEHNQAPEYKLVFILYDQHAKSITEALQRRFPQMPEVCEFLPADIDVSDEDGLENAVLHPARNGTVPDIVYICVEDHSLGFQTALQLRGLLPQKTIPIIVSMSEDSGLAVFIQGDSGTASSQLNIHPFDILKHTCTPGLILRGSHELMARAVHETYLQQRLEEGEELGQRRALVPWESLPDDLRESNRRQVDLIRIKLDHAGLGIKPLVDWDARFYRFSEDQIELMAQLEHRYWMDERTANGWIYGPGPENLEKKTHPDLLTWEQLSEETKDKDRNTVTIIPKILARAGYQIDAT